MALRRKGNLKDTAHANDGEGQTKWTRIVLLGKTGVGKSASGNTILGQEVFTSAMRMNAVTCESSEKHAFVSDRPVSVVDTPGFICTQMKPEELMMEMARSVYLSSPGPHAFVIVLRVDDRFTDQELQIPQMIEKLFDKEVLKYSIILFTHGDQLERPIEDLIKMNSRLRHLVDQCGGRYNVFNNRDESNREQVNDLLQTIDKMKEQNGEEYYSHQIYEDAERFRQEERDKKTSSEFKAFYKINKSYFTAVDTEVSAAAGIAAALEFALLNFVSGLFADEAKHTQRKEQERKKQQQIAWLKSK